MLIHLQTKSPLLAPLNVITDNVINQIVESLLVSFSKPYQMGAVLLVGKENQLMLSVAYCNQIQWYIQQHIWTLKSQFFTSTVMLRDCTCCIQALKVVMFDMITVSI